MSPVASGPGVHRDRIEKPVCEKQKRSHAVKLLKQHISTEKVAELSGVTQHVASQLRQAIENNDQTTLFKLLDSKHYHPDDPALENGQDPIAQKEKDQMKLRKRARLSRRKQGRVRSSFPLEDAFAPSPKNAFTLFSPESRETQPAETFKCVKSLDDVLQFVKSEYPSIFKDPRHIWSCHEATVLSQFENEKGCSVSKKDQPRQKPWQNDSHVAASITISAAGSVAPLLVTVMKDDEGMTYFCEPLEEQDLIPQAGESHWLTQRGWCPAETRFLATRDGVLSRENLPLIINTLNELIRVEVEQSQPVLVLLQGHSSPDKITWLEGCEDLNMVIVSLPQNLSDGPQLFRKSINKFFHQAAQDLHDVLKRHCTENIDPTLELMFAVAGHRAISPDIVRNAFAEAKIWPMNKIVIDGFEEQNGEGMSQNNRNNEDEGDTLFYTEVLNLYSHRVRDKLVYDRIRQVTEQGELETSRKLNLIHSILQLDYSVDRIVDTENLRSL
ncbi:hypothetical protein FGB62_34g10 [Gracilaria domingensis]|nr:hypothetical protein FGB62_34g10 [Gracilaria domingensis]